MKRHTSARKHLKKVGYILKKTAGIMIAIKFDVVIMIMLAIKERGLYASGVTSL